MCVSGRQKGAALQLHKHELGSGKRREETGVDGLALAEKSLKPMSKSHTPGPQAASLWSLTVAIQLQVDGM